MTRHQGPPGDAVETPVETPLETAMETTEEDFLDPKRLRD